MFHDCHIGCRPSDCGQISGKEKPPEGGFSKTILKNQRGASTIII
ncbi:hypothetical protein OHAE_2582 [Ochrobactrum soli]|uniref:Uncharacterized protein n=1 Tax=Ochrobactrum soli TaxID=2448455 RepID=A0A2P9HRH4_9HYPH|nr:hypothetical protein OHAE_2582 [[Ochrobactrum] soli]